MKNIDNVNNPIHYAGKIETIEYIHQSLDTQGTIAYCVGNVIKYLSRYRKKNGLEDLKKAEWYLDKTIELVDLYPDVSLLDSLTNTFDYIEDKQNSDGVQGYYVGCVFSSLADTSNEMEYLYASIYLERLINYLEASGEEV